MLLIDADSIIWICHWHQIFKSWDKPLDLIKHDVDSLISHIILETKAKEYLGFVGKGRGFRKVEFSDYKGNREDVIRPPYLDEVKQYMIDKWEFISVEEFEPDDAVCILKKKYPESIISAIDKDVLNNIEGKHYNYKKREWVTTSLIEADRHFWTQMISGDSADGIKGIPGKGKSFASKLFEKELGNKTYSEIVLKEYILYYGEYLGISYFYKSYILLKMLDTYESFDPQPIKVDINKLII